MLDPLDWVEGWPTVRGGFGVSETLSSKPAAQPGEKSSYKPVLARPDMPGSLIAELSDEFDGSKPIGAWAGDRVPDAGMFGLTPEGTFSFAAQPRDLQGDKNDASVLTEPAPEGDYIVETRLHFPLSADFSNHNYVQAGLVIYGDDNNYIKLVHLAWNGTRQIDPFLWLAGAQAILCLAGAALVWKGRSSRAAFWIILGVGVLLRLGLVGETPTLSDDIYRYIGDGRVQAASINSCRYIPADPHLTFLRDDAIYPHINRRDYAPTRKVRVGDHA